MKEKVCVNCGHDRQYHLLWVGDCIKPFCVCEGFVDDEGVID